MKLQKDVLNIEEFCQVKNIFINSFVCGCFRNGKISFVWQLGRGMNVMLRMLFIAG